MEFSKKTRIFGRTRALERQIEEFLDGISEAGLIFRRAIKIYLADGVSADYVEALNDVKALESRGDELRRGDGGPTLRTDPDPRPAGGRAAVFSRTSTG